jgi:hypothetical protein
MKTEDKIYEAFKAIGSLVFIIAIGFAACHDSKASSERQQAERQQKQNNLTKCALETLDYKGCEYQQSIR